MSMPTISYCCIFKDEERHLPKWIECAKAVACGEGDEIIACDTGSTDKSCELLREAGIEPIYFEWVNDFSKAKNFVIDKAKGDWIFFMDCDEYFSKDTLPKVRETVKQFHPTKTMFIQSDMHNIDEDNGDRLISTCFHWRIFRNRPDIRYTKAIHEYVRYTGEGQTIITPTHLLILHTGYSASLTRLKGARNLVFLEEDIAANETNEITTSQAFYMANTYGQLGDLLKACEYADIAIAGPDNELGPMTVKMYKFILTREEMRKGGPIFKNVMDILDEGLIRVPNQPDFLLDKIRYYIPLKRYYEIELFCFKYLNALSNPVIMNRCESQAMTNVHQVYKTLAEMMFHRGNVVEARRFISMALKEQPKNIELLRNFVKYFRYEILSIVEPIIDRIYPEQDDETKEVFKKEFASMNYGDVYLRYAKPKSHSYEYYMCKGLYLKAAKICEKELLEHYKYAAFAYANWPKEAEIFKAAVPLKFLTGAKKQPTGKEMTIKDLMNKFIAIFAKITMAFYSMTNEEFERNKSGILRYLTGPARNFLLAGYGQATEGITLEDTKSLYKLIVTRCNKTCLARLARAVYVMPTDDNFIYGVLKDYIFYKDPQNTYNLIQKLQNKNYNYYLLLGVAFLYGNDMKNARKNFIKARALGANTQELKDYIKTTDPAQKIVVNL